MASTDPWSASEQQHKVLLGVAMITIDGSQGEGGGQIIRTSPLSQLL